MARLTLVQKRGKVRLEFSDREQVWDALFVVDVVLWVVKRFLHLASPWTWLYEVFTNGYFVLWLIYECASATIISSLNYIKVITL